MASGTIEFGASGALQGKISWSSSSNGSSSNSSSVTAILYARRTDSYTTTGSSWSGYVKIGGTQTNIGFSSSVSVGSGWVEMARVSATVGHNSDGTGSVNIAGSVTGPSGTALAGKTSSGNQTVTLDRIARYLSITSFTQTPDYHAIQVNWATDAPRDATYYSLDNGQTWHGSSTYQESVASDNKSGYFWIKNLSTNTSYSVKIKIKRTDSQLWTESSNVSVRTKDGTIAVSSLACTATTMRSATFSYSHNQGSRNATQYSLDGGAWTVCSNSGTFTISNTFEPNTTHKIKIRVQRKESLDWSPASSEISFTTKQIATITEAPNFNIGNRPTIKFSNPSGQVIKVKMFANSKAVTNEITVTGLSSYTFSYTSSNLYAECPNANSVAIKYQITTTENNITYTSSVNRTAYVVNSNPTFTTFTYADINSTTAALTGNNQNFIQGYSKAQVVISAANKMVAKNNATPSKYTVTVGNRTSNVNYSTNQVSVSMDKVNSTSISVRAIDSRGNSTTVTRSNITNIAYSDISISKFTVDRKDGVSTAMILTLQGKYSNTNFGAVTNSVKTAQIRYKATSSSTWGNWINVLSLITRSNGNITASAVEVPSQTFTVGTTYDIQIQLIDELSAVTLQTTLNSGKPIFSAVKGRGMAINGLYDTSKGGALQVCNGDASFENAIKMSNGSTSDKGIVNSGGSPILQDYNNQNVVLNASGGGLYIGYKNTTKIDILSGKATIDSNGVYNGTATKATTATSATSATSATTATNANNIAVTNTNPSSTGNYYLTWTASNSGNNTPRANNGLLYATREGTASQEGYAILQLGNAKANGTAGNKRGFLMLYGTTAYYTYLVSGAPTSNRTITLPNASGTLRLAPVNLYNNSTGTNGTVTLSQSAANFSWIEIFYRDYDNHYNSVKVYAPNGKKAWLSGGYIDSGHTNGNEKYATVSISGTSITKTNYAQVPMAGGTGAASNYIYITRVDGHI